MLEDIKKDAARRMTKSVAALKDEFRKLRTGRAHTALLEHVTVEYYGSQVPISQTATVAVEDARTLTVAPWEKQMAAAVEKAILTSDLGLTPVSAGNIRRDALGDVKDLLKEKLVTEDEDHQAHDEIQKLTDGAVAQMDQLLKDKETEIMEF